MILRPKLSPRHHATLAVVASTVPMATVPAWLRSAIPDAQSLAGKELEDLAIAAGAAIGALDGVVRRQERWAGAWRQRLALGAAAVTAKQAGRVEGEGALRDAVLLTRPGDDVGPAGRMVLGWRRLAGMPAEELLTKKSLAAVLEQFGYVSDDEVVSDLADDVRKFDAGAGTVGMLAGAFVAAERYGFGGALGAWLCWRNGWAGRRLCRCWVQKRPWAQELACLDRQPALWRQALRQNPSVPRVCLPPRHALRCAPSICPSNSSAVRENCLPSRQSSGPGRRTLLSTSCCRTTRS
jgi:hypothetical protein